MNKQESISSFQMAMLFLAFVTGSSIVNIPSPLTGAAKNGAWLSVLIACAMGMLILACILYLHRQYPGLTFIEYSSTALGKWLTILVSIPLLCALFWMCAAIVIDIGGFFNTTIMEKTPSYIVHSLIFLTSALTARAGIEVMARMFILLLLTMFGFIIAVLLMVIPYYHPYFLFPLFPDGFKPVLHGAYIAYGFPYAELSLFAMLIPSVRRNQEQTLGKFMYFALLVSGITLMTAVACSIMALGPLSGNLKYSLYQLARLISFQDFFERIESLIGFSLITGSYMKATITLFVLTKVLSQLFNVRDDRILTFPATFVCLLLSSTMYNNEMGFVESVTVVWPLFINAVYILPLIIITAVTLFRRKSKRA